MGLFEHWPYVNFHELNLDWILEEMHSMQEEIEKVKNLSVEMEELKDAYDVLINMYNQLEEDYQAFATDMNRQFIMLSEQVRADLERQMRDIRAEIQAFENATTYRMDGFEQQLGAMNTRLDDALENLSDSIRIFNPFTGALEPIAQVIQMLASFHMSDALTAQEYDDLHLTAQTYDNKGITAYQYDVLGSQYLP